MEQHRAEARMRRIFNGTEQGQAGQGRLRVAAYCRVSTGTEAQATSLETQIAAFRKRIAERSGWELVDIYADEGLSGTSVKKRKAFQRMLADCEAGRIDYIITKSISRFARNTLECLAYIRQLQDMGVQLLFEKENIDTGSRFSEMVLTVLAAFAQEESRSISANVTWSLRKKFEAGEVRWSGWYGYRRGPGGEMEVEPREAEVVRRIYAECERGRSLREIAQGLDADGIPSPRGKQWPHSRVSDILKNEVYVGDVLLQKFRTIDHLSHRSVRNDATEVPSYYISDHHPPIVDREVYDRVRRVQAMRRRGGGETPQYPYGELDIRCPKCGARLVQRNTRGFASARMALGCFSEGGCGRFALRREKLSAALLEAYNGMEAEALRAQGARGERFLQMKAEQPKMESVELYWLDELVERAELEEAAAEDGSPAGCWTLAVRWRCGLESRTRMRLGPEHNRPEAVAAQYYANESRHRARRAAARERADSSGEGEREEGGA